MSPPVEFQLDPEVNALSVELGAGAVSRTVELTDSVYADLDAAGLPVGIEFIDADGFIHYLRNHADDADLPPRVRELFSLTRA